MIFFSPQEQRRFTSERLSLNQNFGAQAGKNAISFAPHCGTSNLESIFRLINIFSTFSSHRSTAMTSLLPKKYIKFEPDEMTSSLPPSPAPSSPRPTGRRYAMATELVFVDNPETGGTRDQYGSSSMPIYQTATFKQTSASEMGEYDYTRSGNPTRSHLGRYSNIFR